MTNTTSKIIGIILLIFFPVVLILTMDSPQRPKNTTIVEEIKKVWNAWVVTFWKST